jgi:hypothetical protein
MKGIATLGAPVNRKYFYCGEDFKQKYKTF